MLCLHIVLHQQKQAELNHCTLVPLLLVSPLLVLPVLSLNVRNSLFRAFSALKSVASQRAYFVSRGLLQHAGWQSRAKLTSTVANRALR